MEEHKKQITVRLTFTATLGVERAREATRDEGTTDYASEYVLRQQHLLEALLADQEALEQFLVRRVALQLEQTTWEEWHTLLLGELVGDEEILAPVVGRLSGEEQAYFAADGEEFHERTDLLRSWFETKLERTEVQVREDE